ncbi:two-component sensor histidine kinase [Burkholderia sp. SFA1]|uniref:sensor histidine kinase n=1 Tax=unclassified Caballeronia TaxID=2646786 RepID=UPI001F297CE6|nr:MULTISPECIES: ATP-binding protein [unclassified Caballeronia]MCE4544891.1 ATP-binding protein [Caballeronia sp. PC1]MCE4570315.1 ATP-binding protein [Caballeronia sp. CLC5]BBP98153.1 two-component sensor histidine kinase [Burkholderia sp. SFA1]
MRLTELHRTSSFRLATSFLALFGVATLVLFTYLYVEITGFENERVDDWLVREHAELRREQTADLAARFEQQNLYDTRHQRPFGLFDAQGRHIAGGYPGDRPEIPAFDTPFALRLTGLEHHPPARCIAMRLPDARVALQCQNIRDLDHFDEELLRALLTAGVLTLSVALIGAVLVGVSSMRRLDAVTASIEEIVAGNLSRRLPLHAKEDDLDRLVRVVNDMLDEIERLMHEVKGVCDNIAHDLRTPLTRLIASLERAQRRAMNEASYHATLDEVIEEAVGILRTFNALLRISEIESGARREHFSQVDLGAVAADVFELYEPAAEDRAITLALHRDDTAPYGMLGDSSLLFEAIANLAENAIKFAPPGGHVCIELFRNQEAISIRVRDDGPGIPADERDAVFTRFYRGESSRHTPGSGLGLSLVLAVARMHGMTVSLEDIEQGCSIVLTTAP